MSAKLIEVGVSEAQTREILVHKEEFLIGRGSDCDLRLRASAISRHHCLIRLRGEEAWLSDLGSSNGTFLNGQRVRSQAPLHGGDEIAVGACRFVFDLSAFDAVILDGHDNTAEATLRLRGTVKPIDEENERGRSPGEASGLGDSRGECRDRIWAGGKPGPSHGTWESLGREVGENLRELSQVLFADGGIRG